MGKEKGTWGEGKTAGFRPTSPPTMKNMGGKEGQKGRKGGRNDGRVTPHYCPRPAGKKGKGKGRKKEERVLGWLFS